MNIYKSLEVGGSTFSFVPENKPTAQKQAEPNIDMRSSPSIETQLLELSTSHRKQLLSKVFSSELEELKSSSQEEGFAIGKQDAETLAQDTLAHQHEELATQIESWKKMMLDKEEEIICKIEQEEDFRALLLQAVTKLLLTELTNENYIETVISNVISEFSSRKAKKLVVSELHYNHLKKAKNINSFSTVYDLQSDPNLLPGSFKLEFDQGFVEYDLGDVFVNFKKQLLHPADSASKTNVRP